MLEQGGWHAQLGGGNGRKHRTLHLIDAENLVGEAHADPSAIATAGAVYPSVIDVEEQDLVWVGGHPLLAWAAEQGWPGSRFLPGHGPSGADLALIGAADPDFIARRFTGVVIASGDGIFTEIAVALGWRGLHVTVTAPRRSLSYRLRHVAQRVEPFPEIGFDGPLSAAA